MIEHLYSITAAGTVPYRNQALERYLLEHAGSTDCVLYLWQNRRTVVIGRNQNAWKECSCSRLEADGGFLARRLSGGGAVFHDNGNLNFTFVCSKQNYDVPRQTDVILEAVRQFGVPAECTGRNDITVAGKKFSGNAYYLTDKACFHHGTLLLSENKENLAAYLTVPSDKLSAKGVDSVRSRVTNLCEYVPGLTAGTVSEKLFTSFAAVYGLPVEPYQADRIDGKELSAFEADFSSWDWRYGRTIPFTAERHRRFVWGSLDIQLAVHEGIITDAALWTDALDTGLVQEAARVLEGCRFSGAETADRLSALLLHNDIQKQMMNDIRELLEEML
ncbi:MAG: lipoate--protein ligase [Treponema sp.]|nr:lipoate--protein ligase [Treponema sp.]